MRIRNGIAVLCVGFLPMAALADDAHHPDGRKAKPAAKGEMQGHMTKMREQMERIRAENDPVKRGQLIDEHMKAMHESMPMMRGMMHDKGGMMGGKPGMQDGAPMK
jgi:hypothetical protein